MLEHNFSLTGKIALLTGASRGIGYHFALNLAKRGAHIIAIARNQQKLRAVEQEIHAMGGSVTALACDVTNKDLWPELQKLIKERWDRLDILIANAAILGPLTPITHLAEKDLYETFYINTISQWLLLRTVHPFLIKSEAARLLFMSSGAARRSHAFWGAYAASKAALEQLVISYGLEHKHLNLRANLANPGATATDMRALAMPGEDPATLPSAAEVASSLIRLIGPNVSETAKLFDYRQDKFID